MMLFTQIDLRKCNCHYVPDLSKSEDDRVIVILRDDTFSLKQPVNGYTQETQVIGGELPVVIMDGVKICGDSSMCFDRSKYHCDFRLDSGMMHMYLIRRTDANL